MKDKDRAFFENVVFVLMTLFLTAIVITNLIRFFS